MGSGLRTSLEVLPSSQTNLLADADGLFSKQDLSTYQHQTTIFFADPYQYLIDRFPSAVDTNFPISPYPASTPGVSDDTWRHEWPRYLVLFGALLKEHGVKEYLIGKGYNEVWRWGRSWEGDSDERKGGVRVWKWEG